LRPVERRRQQEVVRRGQHRLPVPGGLRSGWPRGLAGVSRSLLAIPAEHSWPGGHGGRRAGFPGGTPSAPPGAGGRPPGAGWRRGPFRWPGRRPGGTGAGCRCPGVR